MVAGKRLGLMLALAMAAGTPAAIGQGAARRVLVSPTGSGGSLRILEQPEVQRELKLTPSQSRRVAELAQQRQQAAHTGGTPGAAPDAQALRNRIEMGERQLSLHAEGLLSGGQQQRLRQLQYQRDGARALADPKVQQLLSLTAEQAQKVRAILDEESRAQEEVAGELAGLGSVGTANGTGRFGAVVQKLRGVRAATDQKILTVLTAPQRQRWKELQGAPFAFRSGVPGGEMRIQLNR